MASKALKSWKQVSPILLLATLALTPAIIEELCFRGFLFSALSRSMSPGRVIATTAVVFGLFHVLTGSSLLIERFIPSTLLGLILGWIAYRSGSVIPGMVMHFVHNGFLELVARYRDQLTTLLGEQDATSDHLPISWVIIASLVAMLGGSVIWYSTRANATASNAH
jgi:ABC-2 type transport system permease protein/sodium transport system permease protein